MQIETTFEAAEDEDWLQCTLILVDIWLVYEPRTEAEIERMLWCIIEMHSLDMSFMKELKKRYFYTTNLHHLTPWLN